MIHLLAVDDSLTIRQLIEISLKTTEDIDVKVADSGEAALQLAVIHDFDLILLDWSMEPMNGAETLEKLRRMPNYQNTPIIILSADGESTTKAGAKALGADGWMVKPFNPHKLIDLVRRMGKSNTP